MPVPTGPGSQVKPVGSINIGGNVTGVLVAALVGEGEEETRKVKSIQQTLRWIEGFMTGAETTSDQVSQQHTLLQQMPFGKQPGAIEPKISDIMLQYVDNFDKAVFEDAFVTFKGRNRSSSDTLSLANGCNLQSNFEDLLRNGQVRYEFVQVPKWCPDYVFKAVGLERSSKCLPGLGPVFRVLIKDNKIMQADLVSPHTLRNIGWRWKDGLLERYWWRYERGKTKSIQNTAFRVRLDGKVDSVWSIEDHDPEFESYLTKSLAENQWQDSNNTPNTVEYDSD